MVRNQILIDSSRRHFLVFSSKRYRLFLFHVVSILVERTFISFQWRLVKFELTNEAKQRAGAYTLCVFTLPCIFLALVCLVSQAVCLVDDNLLTNVRHNESINQLLNRLSIDSKYLYHRTLS